MKRLEKKTKGFTEEERQNERERLRNLRRKNLHGGKERQNERERLQKSEAKLHGGRKAK